LSQQFHCLNSIFGGRRSSIQQLTAGSHSVIETPSGGAHLKSLSHFSSVEF